MKDSAKETSVLSCKRLSTDDSKCIVWPLLVPNELAWMLNLRRNQKMNMIKDSWVPTNVYILSTTYLTSKSHLAACGRVSV